MKIILMAAIGKGREIGKAGNLIWCIPADLKRFRMMTTGHPVIMGRKTYASLPDNVRPLLERTNIILSRSAIEDERLYEDVYGAQSLPDALGIAKSAEGDDEIYVIGGAEIYRLFLPHAHELRLTEIDARDASADAYFPQWSGMGFREMLRESHRGESGLAYDFVTYEKAR